ncbi:hypothetical protein [Paenibacillus naphthalenovorans]|uniref:hypothetical protein n=1 Tax=Paenibacillus naphthalenovorans TaxID=162209 RepID=UPI003D299BDF
MLTSDQVNRLQSGDIMVILNHWKDPNLNGREFVFTRVSPADGFVLGRLIIKEKGTVRLGEEATFRMDDINVKPARWEGYHLRATVEETLRSLERQKEFVEEEMVKAKHTNDNIQYLSRKNEAFTLDIVIRTLQSAL